MKRLVQQVSLLVTGAGCAPVALAHAGDHAAFSVLASIAHFLGDPWHAGFALAASFGVAAFCFGRGKDRGTRT